MNGIITEVGTSPNRRDAGTSSQQLVSPSIRADFGESSIATTMNIYVKSVSESQVEAMRRLEDALLDNAENLCAPSVHRIN